MRAALLIALKDLRQRLRDRSFLLVAIVAPLGLALLFGFLLSTPEQQEEYDFQARYGVVDLDEAPVGDYFTDVMLARTPGVQVESVASVERALELAQGEANPIAGEPSDQLHAVFVIPEGFSADVQSARPAELRVIANRQAPFEAGTAVAMADEYASQLTSVRVATATFEESLGEDIDRREIGFAVLQEPLPLSVEAVEAESTALEGATYYAVGMTVFFLFFTVQFGVLNLIQEREDGTLRRLLVAPISHGSIIGGKMLTSILAGVISGVVLVVATTNAADAEWGDPVGLVLLLVAFVIAAAGIVSLVIGFVRTAQQAETFSTQIGTVLGILGGAFFTLSLGGWFEHLQLVSPHRWFITGIEDLGGGGLSAIVQPVVVLLVIGVVAFSLSVGGLGRRLQS